MATVGVKGLIMNQLTVFARCVVTVASSVLEEDAVSVHAGKEFAMMRTQSGKVCYTSLVYSSACFCR